MSEMTEWKERFFRRLLEDEAYAAFVAKKLANGLDASGGPESCWPWRGVLTVYGYGQIHLGSIHLSTTGKKRDIRGLTHRVAYVIHNKCLPEGGCVMHLCDNRPCSNPHHLVAGTNEDNLRDMRVKGRHRKKSTHTYANQTGERNGRALRAERDVLTVIRLAKSGVLPQTISEITGHSREFVGNVIGGQSWSWLTGITRDNPIRFKAPRNPRKFSAAEMQDMKTRWASRTESLSSIGRSYDIGPTRVFKIVGKREA